MMVCNRLGLCSVHGTCSSSSGKIWGGSGGRNGRDDGFLQPLLLVVVVVVTKWQLLMQDGAIDWFI